MLQGQHLINKKYPRRAVCRIVLNLHSQVWDPPPRSALAEAYRVTPVIRDPAKLVLAQNRSCCITYTAGLHFLYHKILPLGRHYQF